MIARLVRIAQVRCTEREDSSTASTKAPRIAIASAMNSDLRNTASRALRWAEPSRCEVLRSTPATAALATVTPSSETAATSCSTTSLSIASAPRPAPSREPTVLGSPERRETERTRRPKLGCPLHQVARPVSHPTGFAIGHSIDFPAEKQAFGCKITFRQRDNCGLLPTTQTRKPGLWGGGVRRRRRGGALRHAACGHVCGRSSAPARGRGRRP